MSIPPGPAGEVEYHDGVCCTDKGLRYHLADDWYFLHDGNLWRFEADRLRKERFARKPMDARAVFYGRPLLEFVARECWQAFARREEITAEVCAQETNAENALAADDASSSLLTEEDGRNEGYRREQKTELYPDTDHYDSPFYDTIRQIHASWMLTPREELHGLCPREVARQSRGHLSADLQNRRDQWSRLQTAPPGISESSHAYLHGGFGPHEMYTYYEFVRAMIWSSWDRLTELDGASQSEPASEFPSLEAFISEEVQRLQGVRETWLDAPDPEFHNRTPRSIINRERARIPEAVSGQEAIIDPDCPCCQMMSDLPGPMFWHLDGCNQDEDFAFDLEYATREKWEEEQRQWEERHRRFNEEWAERERLGVTDYAPQREGSTWSRSFSLDDQEIPLGVRIFSLGCQLAELIVQIREGVPGDATPSEVQAVIDQLNRHFGNLRDILQDENVSLGITLMTPVMERFSEALETLAADRPDVAESCESLNQALIQLLDPDANESEWKDGGSELPF